MIGLTKKIKAVYSKAATRPSGYVEDIQAHSECWNEATGEYVITPANWEKLCIKYRPVREATKQSNPKDRCQYRTCGGCSGGPQCTAQGMACPYGPGTYEQCETWREMNK